MLEALIFVIFPFCMVFAAVSDALSMTIANRVSLVLVGSFIVIAPLTGMEWSAVGMHVAAGALVLSATFMLFAIGGMGGGDAKLMAATAVWMGFDILLLEYLLYASFVGGVLTFATLMYRKSFLADFTRNNMFLRHFADTRVGIPYGVALGFAGLMIYPKTSLVVWAMARLAG